MGLRGLARGVLWVGYLWDLALGLVFWWVLQFCDLL